ncbi:MAG: isoprenyl transferase [Flavobacteriales bacterium]|jgi:undecaprenyl diphosphate synthase|uniref:isoprenyl transferase n=1 Tax=Blattabacterium sp. (Mastotermes darwiniensis) TaxID=39768 RepID=UPI000231DEF6|nr:isoprenyl transferase [Blattabacterium sp. (Mastotermes darwiniensis)]AER40810.1 undecaprenyl diphosphate synthase [Blattabacterium sp. (Mastotermes darwiniensis) str. MADAR]MDR1804657.1 isoprenyl transferase [Flavobacteriales bacterium]
MKNKIDLNNIPNHVGIIMDGNGRWAEQRGKLRTFGHENSIQSVKDSIVGCKELGIPYMTLYVFSSENWNRPKKEIDSLMRLLHNNLKDSLEEIHNKNVKIIAIGEIEKFPVVIQKRLFLFIKKTENNTSMTLVLALSYGSREEIIRATKIIAKKVYMGNITLEDINFSFFQNHLYTKKIPDVDLIIRTSGEQRISNFLLWQSAYAELYFTNVLWPDFRKKDFFEAIINYQKRRRRFGKVI